MNLHKAVESKLHPARFSGISPLMAAIVGGILGTSWTSPTLVGFAVTSDGFVLACEESGGFDHFISSLSEVRRNWVNLLDAARLTLEERTYAENCYYLAGLGKDGGQS